VRTDWVGKFSARVLFEYAGLRSVYDGHPATLPGGGRSIFLSACAAAYILLYQHILEQVQVVQGCQGQR
jgi:hypothetical protein